MTTTDLIATLVQFDPNGNRQVMVQDGQDGGDAVVPLLSVSTGGDRQVVYLIWVTE